MIIPIPESLRPLYRACRCDPPESFFLEKTGELRTQALILCKGCFQVVVIERRRPTLIGDWTHHRTFILPCGDNGG